MHGVALGVKYSFHRQQLHDANTALNQVQQQGQGCDDVFAREAVKVFHDQVAAARDPPFLDQGDQRGQRVPIWVVAMLSGVAGYPLAGNGVDCRPS
jgi:hypothetical protein